MEAAQPFFKTSQGLRRPILPAQNAANLRRLPIKRTIVSKAAQDGGEQVRVVGVFECQASTFASCALEAASGRAEVMEVPILSLKARPPVQQHPFGGAACFHCATHCRPLLSARQACALAPLTEPLPLPVLPRICRRPPWPRAWGRWRWPRPLLWAA